MENPTIMSSTSAFGTAHVPSLIPVLNPLIRRLLGRGLPFGPNVLLTVRGRTSGRPHTFPVAILEHDGRRFVQSPFGEVNWVRNLRACSDAVIAKGRDREDVEGVELEPEMAGPIYRDALAPYRRSRLLRPIVARYFHLGNDTTTADYVEHARAHPMFELRPRRAGNVEAEG